MSFREILSKVGKQMKSQLLLTKFHAFSAKEKRENNNRKIWRRRGSFLVDRAKLLLSSFLNLEDIIFCLWKKSAFLSGIQQTCGACCRNGAYVIEKLTVFQKCQQDRTLLSSLSNAAEWVINIICRYPCCYSRKHPGEGPQKAMDKGLSLVIVLMSNLAKWSRDILVRRRACPLRGCTSRCRLASFTLWSLLIFDLLHCEILDSFNEFFGSCRLLFSCFLWRSHCQLWGLPTRKSSRTTSYARRPFGALFVRPRWHQLVDLANFWKNTSAMIHQMIKYQPRTIELCMLALFAFSIGLSINFDLR